MIQLKRHAYAAFWDSLAWRYDIQLDTADPFICGQTIDIPDQSHFTQLEKLFVLRFFMFRAGAHQHMLSNLAVRCCASSSPMPLYPSPQFQRKLREIS